MTTGGTFTLVEKFGLYFLKITGQRKTSHLPDVGCELSDMSIRSSFGVEIKEGTNAGGNSRRV